MTPKKCPKCGHSHLQKHGKIADKQRYLCPNCKFQFTRIKPVGKPKKLKKMALKMYLEGLGFRQIGRILGLHHSSIFRWIKDFEKQTESQKMPLNSQEVEIDGNICNA